MLYDNRELARIQHTCSTRPHGVRRFEGLTVVREAKPREWPEKLGTYLTSVGRSLIAWTRRGRAPNELAAAELAECDARAFGYGKHGSLMVTDMNVPTSTVTALWCPGMHDGRPWMPLVLRQGKLRHLVLG